MKRKIVISYPDTVVLADFLKDLNKLDVRIDKIETDRIEILNSEPTHIHFDLSYWYDEALKYIKRSGVRNLKVGDWINIWEESNPLEKKFDATIKIESVNNKTINGWGWSYTMSCPVTKTISIEGMIYQNASIGNTRLTLIYICRQKGIFGKHVRPAGDNSLLNRSTYPIDLDQGYLDYHNTDDSLWYEYKNSDWNCLIYHNGEFAVSYEKDKNKYNLDDNSKIGILTEYANETNKIVPTNKLTQLENWLLEKLIREDKS